MSTFQFLIFIPQLFDPSFTKKKKKKKTTFDLDAALAEDGSALSVPPPTSSLDIEEKSGEGADNNIDLDNDLDLETFGKKKKKKKKGALNMDDVEAALPEGGNNEAGGDEVDPMDEDGLDLSTTKKKKKKKAGIDELLKEEEENNENGKSLLCFEHFCCILFVSTKYAFPITILEELIMEMITRQVEKKTQSK